MSLVRPPVNSELLVVKIQGLKSYTGIFDCVCGGVQVSAPKPHIVQRSSVFALL